MNRTTSIIALLTLLAGAVTAASLANASEDAQGVSSNPILLSQSTATSAPLYSGVPRTPDVPNSLLQPAPSTPLYSCNEPECPYFEHDSHVDWPDCGEPGFLADVDVDLTKVHVVDNLLSIVNANTVAVPMANLQWTVSPRVEMGWRLPEGFGEFDVSYRFVYADGAGSWSGGPAAPDGTAALTSNFRMNVGDFDYASNERSLCSLSQSTATSDWYMKWRIGLRFADNVFSSTADESLAEAAGGSDIFQRSIHNEFHGLGPHSTLELRHPFGESGLSLVSTIDGAIIFGNTQQTYSEVSANPALSGQTYYSNAEQLPTLNGSVGLEWRPPQHSSFHVFCGYQAEYWWNVGRMDDPYLYGGASAAEFSNAGVQLRLEYNY